VGIALLLAAHGTASRGVTLAVLVLAGAMALGDALENRELLRLAGITDPAAMWPALSRLRVFTSIKWAAIYAASALVAACIWRERGWWRWSAPFFCGGGDFSAPAPSCTSPRSRSARWSWSLPGS